MSLMQRLAARRIAEQMDRLVTEVVGRSHDAVNVRLNPNLVSGMGYAEASGYVRARAAAVVHREVDAALSRVSDLPTWSRSVLISRSTDGIVHQVTRELVLDRMRVIPRRKAG